jgi:hypothetical protein
VQRFDQAPVGGGRPEDEMDEDGRQKMRKEEEERPEVEGATWRR